MDADYTIPTPKLSQLLSLLVELHGSDLHLTPLNKPNARIDGELAPFSDIDSRHDFAPLTAEDTKTYAHSVLSDVKLKLLETDLQVDASISIKGLSRFRVNVCHGRAGLSITFRVIPFEPLPLEDRSEEHTSELQSPYVI